MVHFVSPNWNELKVIGEQLGISIVAERMDLAAVRSVAERLNEYIPVVVTTLGVQGVLVRISIAPNRLPKSTKRFDTFSLTFYFAGDPKSFAK